MMPVGAMVRACSLLAALVLMLPARAVGAPWPEPLTVEGVLAQGGLAIGRAPGCRDVRLDGRPLMLDEAGRFVFGFGRDAPREHRLTVVCGGRGIHHRFTIASRRFPLERIDGLPERMVTLPPEELARRRREIAAVTQARAARSLLKDVFAGFLRPVEGRISGVYGAQRILNGRPRTPHYGLDIAAPAGTPVVAPAGGIVRLVGDFLLEGRIIVIDHGMGVTSTLFHLQDITVEQGARVRRGQVIGHVGASGRATGPHVDWRVNWGEVRIDPALALDLKPGEGGS